MTLGMFIFSVLAGGFGGVLVDQLTGASLSMPGRIGSGALGGASGGSLMLARADSAAYERRRLARGD